MNRTEHYMRLVERHGAKEVVGFLLDVIAGLRAAKQLAAEERKTKGV